MNNAAAHSIDLMHRSPVTDCLHYGTRADCKIRACVAAAANARPVCPECGGPVVLDGGLWHCDEGGHGAWDRASLIWIDTAGNEVDDPSDYTRRAIAARKTREEA